MIITIRNNVNGNTFRFLDQREIRLKYGNEKVTLGLDEFIENQDLNLYSVGGDGNLYSLPEMEAQGYSRNFSQDYGFLDTKYNQRTIELGSIIPALLITRSRSLYNYINDTLYEDGTTLSMLIDTTNDGGRKMIISRVSCTSSPLSDSASNYNFLVWGDSAYSFEGLPIVEELDVQNLAEQMSYDKSYDLFYEPKIEDNIVIINNTSAVNLDVNILFLGGICTNPLITNLSTNEFSGYDGFLIGGDKVIINSENRSLNKNGVSELQNLTGAFFELKPGENKLKFTVDSFNQAEKPKAYITYKFKYNSV